jgi:hypothetical protein
VIPPLVIGLALVIALLVMLPSRRLQLAGLDGTWIATYALTLWVGAMLIALFPGGVRFLFPILLIAWVAPFIVAPERIGRTFRGGRGRGRRPQA